MFVSVCTCLYVFAYVHICLHALIYFWWLFLNLFYCRSEYFWLLLCVRNLYMSLIILYMFRWFWKCLYISAACWKSLSAGNLTQRVCTERSCACMAPTWGVCKGTAPLRVYCLCVVGMCKSHECARTFKNIHEDKKYTKRFKAHINSRCLPCGEGLAACCAHRAFHVNVYTNARDAQKCLKTFKKYTMINQYTNTTYTIPFIKHRKMTKDIEI